jgi:methyltransferase (TIGR00027 family)
LKRRIETTTSRTAEWTCLARAASTMERDPHYHSDDAVAPLLLPRFLQVALRLKPLRDYLMHVITPDGMYEYVIARTKYIDAAVVEALAERIEQVVVLGAGFDSRAVRFGPDAPGTRFFELDAPTTQQAKIGQYRRRGVILPSNAALVSIDFEHDALSDRLDEAGFSRTARSLFILEGVLMYLQPAAVEATLGAIVSCGGPGSRLVADAVLASVIRGASTVEGEAEIVRAVSKADEGWRFGLDRPEVGPYLARFGLTLERCWGAAELEAAYFAAAGRAVGRVNGTHWLATAAVQPRN